MTGWSRDILRLIGISLFILLLIFLFRDLAVEGIALISVFSETPQAVLIAFALFLIGSIFFVPQWMLIAATVAAFGLVHGVGVAWAGTMLATTTHILFANLLEKPLKSHVDGPRFARLRGLFTRNGFQSGFVIRFIPTGPAIMVNVAAGLMGVHRVGFLLGTALGIIPKILLAGIVASELISTAQGQMIGFGLVALGLLLLAGLVLLGHWIETD